MVGQHIHFCHHLHSLNKWLVLKLFDHKSCFFIENRLLPTEVRKEALQLQKLLEYDDTGAEG